MGSMTRSSRYGVMTWLYHQRQVEAMWVPHGTLVMVIEKILMRITCDLGVRLRQNLYHQNVVNDLVIMVVLELISRK